MNVNDVEASRDQFHMSFPNSIFRDLHEAELSISYIHSYINAEIAII